MRTIQMGLLFVFVSSIAACGGSESDPFATGTGGAGGTVTTSSTGSGGTSSSGGASGSGIGGATASATGGAGTSATGGDTGAGGGTGRGAGTGAGGRDAGQGGGSADAGDCSALERAYQAAFVAAKRCTPFAQGQCQTLASSSVSCPGCKTHVQNAGELDAIAGQWAAAGCRRALCPAIACLNPGVGVCFGSDAGGGMCQDSPIVP